MVVLPWLWLNEAAMLIADRLPETHTYTHAEALNEARDQLLDQAHRGALTIQGSWSQAEEEQEGPPPEIDWKDLNASLFSKQNRFASDVPVTGSIAKIGIEWDYNALIFEHPEIDPPFGYGSLRVQSADIDRLWPISSLRDKKLSAHKNNMNPNESYNTEWLSLMYEAIAELKITDDNQLKAEEIRQWFHSQNVAGKRVSLNQAKAMTTFVRRPESMIGGLKPAQARR